MLPGSREQEVKQICYLGTFKMLETPWLVGDRSPSLPLNCCALGESPNQPQEVPALPAELKSPAEGHLRDPPPQPHQHS